MTINRYMLDFEPALVSATSDEDAEFIITKLLMEGKIPRIADVNLVDDAFDYYGKVDWKTWTMSEVEEFYNELIEGELQ